MLAKGKKSVNGKCVLLCTIDEKLWSNVAHSASLKPAVLGPTRRNLLIRIGLNKLGMLPFSCTEIAGS
jgi:hypothetical protein